MDKQNQTFSQLLHAIDPNTTSSPQESPPPTPPTSFTYVHETLTIPLIIIPDSQTGPYSCSPPKSFTTSALVKAETFDELFKPNDQSKRSFSNDLRKSIRLSSKPSKTSYNNLDNEPDSNMQAQNPTKRLKTSSSAFSPYDRKEAQKEKMMEDIISKLVNIKEKIILNPYQTSPAPEISSRPLCESKSFHFEDMKSRRIMLDNVMTSIGWKEFCEIDEVIYSNLVQKFYSSTKVLKGHDVILCLMNQTQVIITTDVLAKVFNIPNSGVKLYAKDFPVTALKNEYKILHNLCTHGLLPHSRNRHMIAALKDTSGNSGLPYSMALTKIFKEFKLSFIGEEATENLKPFNCKNISHLKVHDGTGTLGLHQTKKKKKILFPVW
ncbi:hypothetical protein MTR_0036s0270 [Medicago truncatula]|uniref:Uncharacterized protein n=1 Tax=Medicago truncatula TaxID=3880 RepID=A0A072TJW2_MEDTR|nr:hypothetical protein MTR_0036s0270 [Medicago truncatula]